MSHPPTLPHSRIIAPASRVWRWVLFGLVLAAILLDKLLSWQGIFAKSLCAGALLGYIMQWIFARLSYRHLRPKAAQATSDMYMAMMARWGVGIVGFILIFLLIKPIMGWAVFLGWGLMQLVIVGSLIYFGKKL